jgi:DNA invertase Pin-like site-specific DNA recombinase
METNNGSAVVYYLTRAGGRANLRLEQAFVKGFLQANGYQQKAEYIEEGPGTGQQYWPVLSEAIGHAQKLGARLVIAKLGRLRWNVAFLRLLVDTRVQFVCCDQLDLWEDNVQIQLKIAQNRAQRISREMRETFARLKADGRKFGFALCGHRSDRRCVLGAKQGGRNSGKARTARANQAYAFLVPRVKEFRAEGMTFDEIVERLNAEGHQTTAGMPFNRPTLVRILQRAEGVKPKKRVKEKV